MTEPSLQRFTDPAGPGGFPTAARCGDLIFTSGQFGVELGGDPVPFAEEARVTLERGVAAVELAGGSRESIVSVRAYLQTMDDWPVWNEVFAQAFPEDARPVRTTVQIGAFLPPMRIEVEFVAAALEASTT
jgi:2-iminobutanoate/2-iminopropanoate deaminase